MYENQTKTTSDHGSRAAHNIDPATQRNPDTRINPDTPINPDTRRKDTRSTADTQRTDPKFVRESFTMRKMQPWQIAALAVAAALVIGLALFYF